MLKESMRSLWRPTCRGPRPGWRVEDEVIAAVTEGEARGLKAPLLMTACQPRLIARRRPDENGAMVLPLLEIRSAAQGNAGGPSFVLAV